MKTCSKCLLEKQLSDFFACNASKDKLHRWCKSCIKESRTKKITSRESKRIESQLDTTYRAKTCTKCNKEKEINMFSKNQSSKDGFNWWCKECFKANYNSTTERINSTIHERLELSKNKTKVCNKCGEIKDASMFCKSSTSEDGLHINCKECKSKAAAISREKNKETINEKAKIYYSENSEKRKSASSEYYYNNIESIRIKSAIYASENKDDFRIRNANRRAMNIMLSSAAIVT